MKETVCQATMTKKEVATTMVLVMTMKEVVATMMPSDHNHERRSNSHDDAKRP
jgi:hypothetical protein